METDAILGKLRSLHPLNARVVHSHGSLRSEGMKGQSKSG